MGEVKDEPGRGNLNMSDLGGARTVIYYEAKGIVDGLRMTVLFASKEKRERFMERNVCDDRYHGHGSSTGEVSRPDLESSSNGLRFFVTEVVYHHIGVLVLGGDHYSNEIHRYGLLPERVVDVYDFLGLHLIGAARGYGDDRLLSEMSERLSERRRLKGEIAGIELSLAHVGGP